MHEKQYMWHPIRYFPTHMGVLAIGLTWERHVWGVATILMLQLKTIAPRAVGLLVGVWLNFNCKDRYLEGRINKGTAHARATTYSLQLTLWDMQHVRHLLSRFCILIAAHAVPCKVGVPVMGSAARTTFALTLWHVWLLATIFFSWCGVNTSTFFGLFFPKEVKDTLRSLILASPPQLYKLKKRPRCYILTITKPHSNSENSHFVMWSFMTNNLRTLFFSMFSLEVGGRIGGKKGAGVGNEVEG